MNIYFAVLVRAWEFGLARRVRPGSAISSLAILLILHTRTDSGAYLRDASRVPRRRPFIYFNRHTPSGQSRVYRVTQLRTDGVHYREVTDTGPEVILHTRTDSGAYLRDASREVILHTRTDSGAYLRDASRVPRRRPFIYFNRHTPSGQSRVYRVTQLRTDGVHYREVTDTGPEVLKVVPVTGAAFATPWTN